MCLKSSKTGMIRLITVLGLAVLVLAYGLYGLKLGSLTFSSDVATWGQFGDFVGGTTNPLLAFLSLLALCHTILLQLRQIEDSARELQITHERLERTAAAQEATSKALSKQLDLAAEKNKLSTIVILAAYYESEITRLKPSLDIKPDAAQNILRINKKLETLNLELEQYYNAVANKSVSEG